MTEKEYKKNIESGINQWEEDSALGKNQKPEGKKVQADKPMEIIRAEEFGELKDQFEEAPLSLQFSVDRARDRAKKKRAAKFFGIPFGSVAAAFCLFVILVNSSMSFAYAAGRLPFIGDLARRVALSPSLKAAVDHEHVQPVNLIQRDGDVTAKVEYVIVDRKQVNIFFSVEGGDRQTYTFEPLLLGADYEKLEEYFMSYETRADWGELKTLTLDFGDTDVPEKLVFILDSVKVLEENEESGITFTFELAFDPAHTTTGKTVEIGQWIAIDKQRVYLDQIEVYPTHLRLNLKDDPENTAWLKELCFSVKDENGNQVEEVKNGISASGSNTPFMRSHRLESNYFSESSTFTLQIEGATWLDKEREWIHLDLQQGICDFLPEGVSLEKSLRLGDGWHLEFLVDYEERIHTVFTSKYRGSKGNTYSFDEHITTLTELDNKYHYGFFLKDYHEETVELQPVYSHRTKLKETVEIPINY